MAAAEVYGEEMEEEVGLLLLLLILLILYFHPILLITLLLLLHIYSGLSAPSFSASAPNFSVLTSSAPT